MPPVPILNPYAYLLPSPNLLDQHLLICDPFHAPTSHGPLDCASKLSAIPPQLISSLLIQRVACVGFKEEVLQADDDGVEVEDGLPVLAKDIEADVAL